VRKTLELGNRLQDLIPTLNELESLLLKESLPRAVVNELRLIAEEGISNIILYAYESGEERRIEVTVSCDGEEVRLELRDDGKPFNPLDAPNPDLDAPLEARPEGGLGIYLMRSLTDEMSYARESGRNVLILKKRL
jgi:anti-sigma regulatory factor (Ser/Thr protein kinase)